MFLLFLHYFRLFILHSRTLLQATLALLLRKRHTSAFITKALVWPVATYVSLDVLRLKRYAVTFPYFLQ